jgi:hypothetical protein
MGIRFLQADGTWGIWEAPDVKEAGVAAKGGEESGVEECIMRYQGEYLYETPLGNAEFAKPGDGGGTRSAIRPS